MTDGDTKNRLRVECAPGAGSDRAIEELQNATNAFLHSLQNAISARQIEWMNLGIFCSPSMADVPIQVVNSLWEGTPPLNISNPVRRLAIERLISVTLSGLTKTLTE